MRKAAGILMIIVGMALVAVGVAFLSMSGITALATDIIPFISLSILYFIPGVLLVAGGGFCLRRRHWRLCFTSALLPVVLMIFWVLLSRFSPWLASFWLLIPMGIPAIIFVYLRKREWQEKQG